MKFNIGLDLNRSHSEMKHNAFPKAKNVLLDDFGEAILTEYGHKNILSSTYTFSKGSIINKDGSTIGTSSVIFTMIDCDIRGYISIEYKILFFVYDTVKKISFILKIDPSNNNYSIYVQNISGVYTTFSFASNSIIKGEHFYNYLGQLIIAFNDVSGLNLNTLSPTFWISNLDETYINENNKPNITFLSNNSSGVNCYLHTNSSGRLREGSYYIAYITLDDNNNTTELSEFSTLPVVDDKKVDLGTTIIFTQGDGTTIIPGATVTNLTSYFKVWERRLNKNGNVNIEYIIHTDDLVGTTYVRIYKNGVAYGTEHSMNGTNYATFTDVLTSFTEDDLIQINVKNSNVIYTSGLCKFTIKGSIVIDGYSTISNSSNNISSAIYKFDTLYPNGLLECITNNTKYKLLIGYKSTNDVNTLYYITSILNKTSIIYFLDELESININNFIQNINIQNVNCLAQYDNKLLLGNLVLLDENYTYLDGSQKTINIELQKVANNIFFTYTTISDPTGTNNIKHKFLSEEIYAFYIEFISKQGTSLGVYHIPGRPSTATELNSVTNANSYVDGIYCYGNINPSTVLDSNTNSTIGTFINSTEYYPSNFPTTNLYLDGSNVLQTNGSATVLASTRIRHHKIPINTQVVDIIARNIVIPSTLQYIISSYRIYYAKRDNINNLILDNSLMHNQAGANGHAIYYSLSFESLFNKVSIPAIAIRRTRNMGAGAAPITLSTYNSFSNTYKILPFSTLYYINSNTDSIFKTFQGYDIQKISQSYMFNTYMENNLASGLPFDFGSYNIYSSNLINNCYIDYTNQKLVLSSNNINVNSTTVSLIGDSYLSFETFGVSDGGSTPSNVKVYNVLLTSKYNSNYRYKLANLISTPEKQTYYPIDDVSTISSALLNNDNPINNDIGVFYKTCLNSQNDLQQPIIFNFSNNFSSNLPNRIIRSNANTSESTIIGWKNITGLDYYDLPKNKGPIINILVDIKRIYIQCRHGLILTDIKDTINQNINVLPLDIFDYPPVELNMNNPIESYNPFSMINTPIGIIVIGDGSKIYNINQDGITDLSLLGVENYLQPLFDPLNNSNFVHIGIDINNKRILFNNPTKTVMLSYNYLNKIFISEHDYCPKFSIQVHNNIFFITSDITKQGLYIFDKTVNTYLGGNTVRESKFDIIFNSYSDITKLLQSVRWITHSIKTDGSEDEFDTFNKLMVYNNTQCSNYIDLRTIINTDGSKFDWFDTRRSLKIYDNFQFNNIFDMVKYSRQPFLDSNLEPISNQFPTKMWYEMSNFISNYFIIRFTYNGTNRLIINSISPELIKTAR